VKVINNLGEVPAGMSSEEEAQFWKEHELGDEIVFRRPNADDPELPPVRERSVAVLPEDVLQRLREVSQEQGVSVRRLLQTLDKPKRSGPIAVRFEDDTVARLKTLAERKGMGYQTLLKTFVQERLYEEEKREGVLG